MDFLRFLAVSIILCICTGCIEDVIIDPADIEHENWRRVNSWETHKIRAGVQREDYTVTVPSDPTQNRSGYATIEQTNNGYRFADFDQKDISREIQTYSVDLSYDGVVYTMEKKSNQFNYNGATTAVFNPKQALVTSKGYSERLGDEPSEFWYESSALYLDDGTTVYESKSRSETDIDTETRHSISHSYPDGGYERITGSGDPADEYSCDTRTDSESGELPSLVIRDRDALLTGFRTELRETRLCKRGTQLTSVDLKYMAAAGFKINIDFDFRFYQDGELKKNPELKPRYLYMRLYDKTNRVSYWLRKNYKTDELGVSMTHYNSKELIAKRFNYYLDDLKSFRESIVNKQPASYTEYKYTYY